MFKKMNQAVIEGIVTRIFSELSPKELLEVILKNIDWRGLAEGAAYGAMKAAKENNNASH